MKTHVKESRLRELEKYANFKGLYCHIDIYNYSLPSGGLSEDIKEEITLFFEGSGYELTTDEIEIIKKALVIADTTGEPDLIFYNLKE